MGAPARRRWRKDCPGVSCWANSFLTSHKPSLSNLPTIALLSSCVPVGQQGQHLNLSGCHALATACEIFSQLLQDV